LGAGAIRWWRIKNNHIGYKNNQNLIQSSKCRVQSSHCFYARGAIAQNDNNQVMIIIFWGGLSHLQQNLGWGTGCSICRLIAGLCMPWYLVLNDKCHVYLLYLWNNIWLPRLHFRHHHWLMRMDIVRIPCWCLCWIFQPELDHMFDHLHYNNRHYMFRRIVSCKFRNLCWCHFG
jgi:hypothetical protein